MFNSVPPNLPGFAGAGKAAARVVIVLLALLSAATAFAATPVNVSFSPNSGLVASSSPTTFTLVQSDADGASDIRSSYLLFNTTFRGALGVYVYYDKNTNKLWMRDDNSTAWLGGFAPGSANVIENTRGKLYCAQTTITDSGNNQTINWRIEFKPTFAGKTVKAWVYAIDSGNAGVGWDEIATIILGRPPVNQGITPSSGILGFSAKHTIAARYSDADGATDLRDCRVILNTTFRGALGIYVYYDTVNNKIWMRDDASSVWLGGFAPGSNNVIENSQGKLYCGETTVSPNSDILTINWKIEFKQALSGRTVKAWLYSEDSTSNSDGWDEVGSFWIGRPPINTSITPSSGILGHSVVHTVSTSYTDPDGATDLNECMLLFNTTLRGALGVFLYYDRNNNKLWLRDDNSSAWLGGFAPGTNNIIENTRGKLHCAETTVVTTSETVTVNWKVEIKPAFSGKTVKGWQYCSDNSGLVDGYDEVASYWIGRPPINLGVDLPRLVIGYGTKAHFSGRYSDPDGAGDLKSVYLLVNKTLTNDGATYVRYDRAANKLWAWDPDLNDWVGGYAPGASNVLETPAATLYCSETTVNTTGENLTVNFRLAMKQHMSGATANTWLWSTDNSNVSDGWDGATSFWVGRPPQVPTTQPALPSVLRTGLAATIRSEYYDPDSLDDLGNVRALLNTNFNGANGIYTMYDANANKLYLRNDANSAWLGGFAPGSANIIENSKGILNCQTTTIANSSVMRVNWNITIKPAWATQTLALWNFCEDDSGSGDGFKQAGTVVVKSDPVNMAVSPNSGTANIADKQTIVSQVQDLDGYTDIKSVELMINTTQTAKDGVYVYFERSSNRIWLRNDNDLTWQEPITLGTSSNLENSQVIVYGAESSFGGTASNLSLSLRVQFKQTVATKTLKNYLRTIDNSSYSDGWDEFGAVTYVGQLSNVSLTPSGGAMISDQAVTLVSKYTHPETTTKLKEQHLLLNTSLSLLNGAALLYDGVSNKLYLRNDNNTAWVGGFAPGTPNTLQNSAVVLYCAETTVTNVGNERTISWRILMKRAAADKRYKAYMYVDDINGQKDGWDEMGSFFVVLPPPPPPN